MAIEVHVQGQMEPGRLADFREAVERWRAYATSTATPSPRCCSG